MDILSFGSGAPRARQPDHSSFSVRVEPRQEAEGSCTSHAVVVQFVAEQAGPHSTSFALSLPESEDASSVQVRTQHLQSAIAEILQASWDVNAQKQALCMDMVCACSCCWKFCCAEIFKPLCHLCSAVLGRSEDAVHVQMIVRVSATVMGRHKGTPALRSSVHMVGHADTRSDTEDSMD